MMKGVFHSKHFCYDKRVDWMHADHMYEWANVVELSSCVTVAQDRNILNHSCTNQMGR